MKMFDLDRRWIMTLDFRMNGQLQLLATCRTTGEMLVYMIDSDGTVWLDESRYSVQEGKMIWKKTQVESTLSMLFLELMTKEIPDGPSPLPLKLE